MIDVAVIVGCHVALASYLWARRLPANRRPNPTPTDLALIEARNESAHAGLAVVVLSFISLLVVFFLGTHGSSPFFVPLSQPLLAGTVTQPSSTLEFDLTTTIQQVCGVPYAIDVLVVLNHAQSVEHPHVQARLSLSQTGDGPASDSGPMSFAGANALFPFRVTVAWSRHLPHKLMIKNVNPAAITARSNFAVSIAGIHCAK